MHVQVYSNNIDEINKIIQNESITLKQYNALLKKDLDKTTKSIIETMKINTEDHIALLNTIKEDVLSDMLESEDI